MMAAGRQALLEVSGLTTVIRGAQGAVRVVDRVSFSLSPGETLALVGESGCGKTLTALSLLRLVDPPAEIEGGVVLFQGRDLLQVSARELRAVRGKRIAMIFQEPMTALNPVLTVGEQVGEALRLHEGMSRRQARARAVSLFREVGIPDPETRVDEYPHRLSGGMRQRVMIAMALACDPLLLIADEPTTAIDVTVQAQILDLLRRVQQERGMALLLITHDLGVVAELAQRVAVMYAGRIVEEALVEDLFAAPSHPYTRGLLASLPAVAGVAGRLRAIAGSVPEPSAFPPGCRFHPRCPERMERCDQAEPAFRARAPSGGVACFAREAEAGGGAA
ncbi:MAG: ABC transporter ATP-binding protein [Planctomycetes bacterium]|nr:ABC transporter ATP-binding protein [Planctomycetota bacterium]